MKNYCLKELAKKFSRMIARLFIMPLCLAYWVNSSCFPAISQFLSQFPGLSGAYIRREFYRLTLISCSHDCFIGYGTIFARPDVKISEGVYIGNYCVIGSVSIAKNTLIASRVSLMSGIKQHQRNEDGSFSDINNHQEIAIGESCWIGEAAVVAANVGSFSNIAAGAVILKDVGEKISAFGNPAKIVNSSSDL